MKRLMIIVAVVMIVIIGGGLTAQIASQGGLNQFPWVIRTTNNPDASALDMAPWKAEQLFLFVGFVLFNLIGIAVTLTVIFWFLNRQVKRAKASSAPSERPTTPAKQVE